MVPKPAARKAKATARRPGRVRSDERLQPSSARPLLPRSAGRTAGTARCIPDRACPDRNLAPRRAGHGVELREEFSNYGKKYVIRPEGEERTRPAISELSMSSALDQFATIPRRDPPPLNGSTLKYGFDQEDHDGKQARQARRDCHEASAGLSSARPGDG